MSKWKVQLKVILPNYLKKQINVAVLKQSGVGYLIKAVRESHMSVAILCQVTVLWTD